MRFNAISNKSKDLLYLPVIEPNPWQIHVASIDLTQLKKMVSFVSYSFATTEKLSVAKYCILHVTRTFMFTPLRLQNPWSKTSLLIIIIEWSKRANTTYELKTWKRKNNDNLISMQKILMHLFFFKTATCH